MLKVLVYLLTPLGLFFAYALIQVLAEWPGESLEIGHVLGFAFLGIGILATIYIWISFIKLKTDCKTLPQFEIETIVGIPKFKETFYSFPIYGAGGQRLGGRTKTVRLIGEVNGIKYNFFAFSRSDIENKKLKFTAITRKSIWLGCNWKKFVVDCKEV